MSDSGVWRGRQHLPGMSPPGHAALLSLVTLQEYHTWNRERVRGIIFLTILLPRAPELHTTWSNFYCASLAELSVIALYLLVLHLQGIEINLFQT